MLHIRLLARPAIEDDRGPRRLEGMKPWALLASLLLAERPLGRRELAERIWPGTADPLASVRWGLLQVRRALEPELTVHDRDGLLRIEPADGAEVDVRRILDGRLEPEGALALQWGELLAGFDYPDAPELEQWLALERARLASASVESLRWAGTLLSRRDPEGALRLLAQATRLEPFDEVAHELTVATLARQGDRRGAEGYLARVDATYRSELGIEAPATIRRPLERSDPAPSPSSAGHVAHGVAVASLREASAARLAVGDYAGAESIARRAAAEAALSGDPRLEASVLVGLATALVHAVRGRAREAVGLLERALALATEAGDERLVAEAERELGWIAFLAGRYGAAEALLHRAIAGAERSGDLAGTARARTILGACRSDRTEFALAGETLRVAIAELEEARDRWLAFATAFLGRVHLRDGDAAEGRRLGDRATAVARSTGALSLLPWTLSIAGEGRLRTGDADGAGRAFEEGLAHALEIGDPCWEAFSYRGVGLVRERSDRAGAIGALDAAVGAIRRFPDLYSWCEALCLTDLIRLHPDVDPAEVRTALRLTSRAPMPDLHRELQATLTIRALERRPPPPAVPARPITSTLASTPGRDPRGSRPVAGERPVALPADEEDAMGKIVYCRDVGFDCDGAVRGPDEESVLAGAAKHAQEGHGVTEITAQIAEKVRSVIREEVAAD